MPSPDQPAAGPDPPPLPWGPDLARALRVDDPSDLAEDAGRRACDVLHRASRALMARVAGAFGDRLHLHGAALCAVGALGRAELVPHADLDLVVLVPDDRRADWVGEAGRTMWDSGLRVDLTVRSPEGWLDLAQEDLAAATALLDVRYVSGPRDLVDRLHRNVRDRAPWRRDLRGFLDALRAEVEARHRRYGGTVYLVEPDLKHGPGGLRDLCVVAWCLRSAREPTAAPPDFEQTLRDADLPDHVRSRLAAAHRLLLALRAAHAWGSGHGGARLGLSDQRRLPAALGLSTAPAGGGDERDRGEADAAEAILQAYFRAAGDVLRYGRRAAESVLPHADGPTRRVTGPFLLVGRRRLRHETPERLARSPREAFATLRLATREGASLEGPTFDAVAAAATLPGDAFSGREVGRAVLDLLQEPGDGRFFGLSVASELGLLEKAIPVWKKMRGRMQYEGLHAYTTDRHSLLAVGFLHGLLRGDYDKSYPLATALMLDLSDPVPVLLAALLHDVGKVVVPARQGPAGAPVARAVGRSLGLSDAAAERVAWLVRHHDTMPTISQRRDLTDPRVIERFRAQVPDRSALRCLYLVSLADMSQVRPGYLTDWKRTLLDELYLRTLRTDTLGPIAPSGPAPEDLRGLPARYYDAYDAQMRARHAAAVAAVRAGRRPRVVDLEPGPGALRMLVVAPDEPGLLAKIAEAFEAFGVDVLAADIFVVPGAPSVALDVFRVRRRGDDGAGWSPEEFDALAARIGRPGPPAEPGPLPSPAAGPGRAAGPTSVRIEPEVSAGATIVEVRTPDRPGVLRRITHAFFEQGVSIRLARCSEDAGWADDVFYVDPVDEPVARALVEAIHRRVDGSGDAGATTGRPP